MQWEINRSPSPSPSIARLSLRTCSSDNLLLSVSKSTMIGRSDDSAPYMQLLNERSFCPPHSFHGLIYTVQALRCEVSFQTTACFRLILTPLVFAKMPLNSNSMNVREVSCQMPRLFRLELTPLLIARVKFHINVVKLGFVSP